MLKSLTEAWKKSKPLVEGTKNKLAKQVKTRSCDHDWKHVQDRTKEVYTRTEVTSKPCILAYCPLCNTTNEFMQEDWEAVQGIQEIRKKYKRA